MAAGGAEGLGRVVRGAGRRTTLPGGPPRGSWPPCGAIEGRRSLSPRWEAPPATSSWWFPSPSPARYQHRRCSRPGGSGTSGDEIHQLVRWIAPCMLRITCLLAEFGQRLIDSYLAGTCRNLRPGSSSSSDFQRSSLTAHYRFNHPSPHGQQLALTRRS